jgi:CRP/FNR family transcriptional regulator
MPNLSRYAPFSHLPAEVIERLAAHVEEIHAKPEHVFFHEGDRSDMVFVVREGRVRVQHHRPDGSVRTICMVGPGDTFCCLPALDGGHYPATAVAAEYTTVYRMPGLAFRTLLEQHPEFSRAALKKLCGQLRESACEGCAEADDVGSRVAAEVVKLTDHFGEALTVTRKELAELAGTTVETAIRVTREFEERGWLDLSRGHIAVKNHAALATRARGERPAD